MTETVEMPPAEEGIASRRVDWALVPRVNLLPSEITEGRRFRRVQFLLGGAVLASVAVAGGATWWAQTEVERAGQELAAVEAQVAALQREQAEYAEAPKVIAEVEAATAARRLAMTQDILWYRYLGDLASSVPSGVTVDTVSIVLSTSPVEGGTAAPLSGIGLGSVAIEGKSSRFGGVSSWMEALEDLPGTNATTLQTAVRGVEDGSDAAPVSFKSGATLTEKALSRRYERKAG